MRTIVIKIDGRVRNDKMGPIGTIACAVDHVHLGMGNCRIEGSDVYKRQEMPMASLFRSTLTLW